MSLNHIVYASKATVEIDDAQLLSIQTSATRNNGRRDITGILLYGRRWFIQLLEGPLENLNDVMEMIRCDDRHHEIEFLSRGPSDERLFPTWSMGVVSLEQKDLGIDIKALWDQLDIEEVVKAGNPKPLYQLFEMFRRQVTAASV